MPQTHTEPSNQLDAERDLDLLFHLSTGLLCIAGVDGYFKKLNPAWTTTLGWTEEELKSQPWLNFVHPDDVEATIQAGEALKSGNGVQRFENRYRSREGDYHWLVWNSIPKLDAGLIFAVVLDLTETRRMEDKLQQAAKMQAIGQLAGGIAHDFNNQLGGILGFADLLNDRLKEQPHLQQYTQNIISAARRAADVTGQLLAFARKGAYQVVPVPLHGLITEVVNLLEHTIERQIQLEINLSDTELIVMGAPSQLENAILNLTLNARDAVNRETGIIQLSTDLVRLDESTPAGVPISLANGDYAVITVADNGVGMTEKVRRHATEPFYTTKEDGKGTGMGLAVVYGTVKHHQGDMVIDSAPDQGTTVKLFLPIHHASAPNSAHTAQTESPGREGSYPSSYPPAPSQKKRVLLVDDEPMIREVGEEMLVLLGYDVVTRTDGEEAVAYYKQNSDSVDIVVLDMMMPRMGGSEAFRLLKEINPKVRVLLASGYSEDSLANQLITEGAAGFIQKPFRRKTLVSALQKILSP